MDISSICIFNFILLCEICLGLILINFFINKNRFSQNTSDSKYSDRVKYAEVNVFRYRPLFLKIGLVGSLTFTLMAFSWTSYEEPLEYSFDLSDDIDDFEIIPPRTFDTPKPPPPPPPPIIEEVENDIPIEDVPLLDTSLDADDPIEIPKPEHIENIPPPPPPLVEQEEDEIFKIVEEMPRFPGCDSGSAAEKKTCADSKLLQYLYKNLKYPAILIPSHDSPESDPKFE